MKFRHRKIKREHSIIQGGLDWLEDLSKKREVIDIIPGVIDITHSKERGIAYQYETPTGCKLLMKKGGAIQEVFVVTQKPEVVQAWVAKTMDELSLFQKAIEESDIGSQKKQKQEISSINENIHKDSYKRNLRSSVKTQKKLGSSTKESEETLLSQRDLFLAGIKEDYQIVEINQGQRDSFVESLASMADLDDPKIEDVLDPTTRKALEDLQEKTNQDSKKGKRPQKG